MAIDWDRAVDVVSGELQNQITVIDEETVNVCAGKVILYIRGTSGGGGGGDAVWGDITGTLSNQTDLQNALNLKANTASLGDMAYIDDAPSDGKEYARKNGAWSEVTGGGGGSAVWGEIDGTLSDQTDLQDALDAKAGLNLIADTFDSAQTYASGDVVIKDGELCRLSILPFPYGFDEIETTEITAQGGARTGDYLTYNGGLYLFVYESAYVVYWNLPTAQEAVESLLSEGRIEEVQYSEYEEAGTYDIGDIVENDGEFYRKSADPYSFEEVTVDELLDEKIDDAPSDNKTYGRKNGAWTEITGGGGGSAAWGDITGTLSNQTDLQTALNAKADTADLGDLAALDNIDYTSNYLTNKPTLGSLAGMSAIDYTSAYLTNKPTLGTLASKNTVDYATEVTNKPTLGTMAAESASDYYDKSEVDDALDAKQDTLTFDSAPTASSANPVTSGGVYTAIHGRALHISMASTSSLGTISNAAITTTMRVVNIVWGTPANVTSNVSWNTDTAGQLVLSGTLAGATTAEIDLIDFG